MREVIVDAHHFAGVGLRVAQRHVAVQVHLVVVADELEHGDVKATGERDAVLCHANGVVFDVGTPLGQENSVQAAGIPPAF